MSNLKSIFDNIIEIAKDYYPSVFTRPMILFCKDHFNNKNLTGCEIGVYQGKNALNILSVLNIKEMFLIDPWGYSVDTGKGVFIDRSNGYYQTLKRLKKFKDKIIIIRDFSENAVNNINKKLDFVYIDGNHNYQNVMNDIINYYPLVKKNGIIGGHDFSSNWLDVIDSVREFSYQNNLELNYKHPDWWIIKNENKIKA